MGIAGPQVVRAITPEVILNNNNYYYNKLNKAAAEGPTSP
jgi:hypothetical protein